MVIGMSLPMNFPAAAPGDLDPGFGTGGKVITPIEPGSGTDYGFAMALQANGKIVVAGNCHDGTSRYDFCLARYSSAGVIDAGFGTGGKVITRIGDSRDYGLAVAVQANGRIVVAGYCDGASTFDFCLARYSSSGVLDTGFGTDGKVISPIGVAADYGRAMALQADGKIIVAGYCAGVNNSDFCLARYSSAGDLDAGFGTGGKVISPIGAKDDFGWGVAVQADGKIVVAGSCIGATTYDDFCVVRYSSAGVLDAGFGRAGVGRSSGKVITPIGAWDDHAQAVAVQSDGKIVVDGECHSNTSDDDFCLARYSAAGVLDATFGMGGKVITPIGGSVDASRAVAVQADGKIVVAGTCIGAGGTDFCLARYEGDRLGISFPFRR
jgi:uncharacterized delta-60 repeat protein